MKLTSRLAATFVALFVPVGALAQTSTSADVPTPPASAGASFAGDTGLWYVSSAEVLPAGRWMAGFSAASETRNRGAIKPNYGAVSLAGGLGRAEVFGSWQLTTEVDGQRGRGDMLLGTKYSVLSSQRGAPVSLAARGVLKVPTGNDEIGASSGRADLLAEIIASRQFGRTEVVGSTGVMLRGNGRGMDQPDGIRTGAGVAYMAHPAVRLFAELSGEAYLGGARPAKLVSPLDTPTGLSAGVSWILAEQFAAGVGVNRALGSRDEVRGLGVAVRVGYAPGARRPAPALAAVPTAPPASTRTTPPPPPPAAPPAGSGAASASRGGAELTLDDVHFDLDKHMLRADAFPILDRAIAAMQADPTLRLQLDGHTCEIGTTEYNLALGARRAAAVRDYLVSRGIPASRLQTSSYGEERPKHSLATEETRSLNRRVELRISSTR